MVEEPRNVGVDLCDELGGGVDSTLLALYEGNPPSRRVASTENFRVIADASPLTVGHLLIVPTRHYLSFAQVVKVLGEELSSLVDKLLPRYRATFGEPLILEHGSSDEMATSACIAHAHLHLLPIEGPSFRSVLLRDGLSELQLDDLDGLCTFAAESYFLYCFAGEILVYKAIRKMRSQYLRSVAAEILEIPEPLWDYSLVVRREMLRETVSRTSSWSHDFFEG